MRSCSSGRRLRGCGWSDLDELVVGDEFDGRFERVADRGRQQHRLVLAGGADVGELLGLHGVHDEIVVAAVQSHDHAFVKRLAGVHEHPDPR